jgi:hypothetical protein
MRRLVYLLLVCLFTLPAQAQSQYDPPLYTLIDGDIYSFSNGVPFRETTWGHNHAPIVSPDGHYIAYGSLPELLVQLDATGGYPINYDQHPPTNIWIMDTATRESTRIADQPEQIAGEEARFSRRSDPVWSPDSTQIAWIEANFHDSEDGLILKVYDLKSGEIRRGVGGLAGAGGDAGFWDMPNTLYWGETLAYAAWTWELPEPFRGYDNGKVLYVLDEQSILRERIAEFPASDTPLQIVNWHWVEYEGNWFIALQYSYGWRLWDTRSDAIYQLDAAPYAETLDGTRVDVVDEDPNHLTLRFEDGRTFTLPESSTTFVISPDGREVAYMERDFSTTPAQGRLLLWENGETRVLWNEIPESFVNGISWSPLRWRVEANPILIADPTPMPVPTRDQG